MGIVEGGFLRLFQTFVYFLAFCCSAIILGFYSYFMAVLSDRKEGIKKDWKAVEGISGVAVVYTICAVVLTCCLGGISFFAFLAVVLNVLFCGGMIAIAVLTRSGAHRCSGFVNTPLGNGNTNEGSGFGSSGFGTGNNQHTTYEVTYGTACHYNKASFIVSIIGAFIFLCLALLQILLVRNRKKENRYGPSPANNYTSGSGRRRFWNRRREAEAGAVGVGAVAAEHHHREHERNNIRPSNDTAFTGSTMAGGNTLAKDEPARNF